MSRYIDVDDALEVLTLMYDNQADKDEPYNVGVMGAINYIKHKAPSINIIRCKDCKYWVSDGGALMICDIHKDPTVPEHFCSYGEREDE